MISQFIFLARLSKERRDLRKTEKLTDFVKGILVGLNTASWIAKDLWLEAQAKMKPKRVR